MFYVCINEIIKAMSKFLRTGISISLCLISIIAVQAQNTEKRVQIKIIENGKVKTDTSFTVNDSVNKNDLNGISEMLNKEDVFVYREHPGKERRVYSYRFQDMPGKKEMDSVFFNNRFMPEDSLHDLMIRKFRQDSIYKFDWMPEREMTMHMPDRFMGEMPPCDCPCCQRRMKMHGTGGDKEVRKEIIIEGDGPEMNRMEDQNERGVVINRDENGKKQIIVNDESGDAKIIRKRIDKDTEIIIIKKDHKKIKQKKNDSRK